MARIDHERAARNQRARIDDRPSDLRDRPQPKPNSLMPGGQLGTFAAKYPGRCGRCGDEWNPGRTIGRATPRGQMLCLPCIPKAKREAAAG